MLVTNIIYIWINIFPCVGVAKCQNEVKTVVLLVLCVCVYTHTHTHIFGQKFHLGFFHRKNPNELFGQPNRLFMQYMYISK